MTGKLETLIEEATESDRGSEVLRNEETYSFVFQNNVKPTCIDCTVHCVPTPALAGMVHYDILLCLN